jgi:hypothetical protein
MQLPRFGLDDINHIAQFVMDCKQRQGAEA